MPKFKKKSSRKDLLKEPEVVRTFHDRALEWVEANQRTATIAVTAVLVAVALVVGVRKYDAYKESQAMALYGQAEAALGPDGEASGAAAEATKAFKAVVDKYPNTAAARYAQLQRANLLFGAGKPQEAATLYEDCLKRFRQDDELELLARQGLAYCRLEAGDLEEARALFEELAATGFGAGTAQLNLGLIYERQGDLAAAVAAYEKAAQLAPGQEALLAKSRLEVLGPEKPEGGA